MGAGFASGDRVVIGIWDAGPLGPMVDVMWARPDQRRILLAPDDDVATFVSGLYRFEEVRVVPIDVRVRERDRVSIVAGRLEVELRAGRASKLFGLRPRFLRRSPAWARIEDAVFRPLVGRVVLGGAADTRVYGVGPSGSRQWYCIESYRPVIEGRASLDGVDFGPLGPLTPRVGFGFSDFPERPAFVECAPVIETPAR